MFFEISKVILILTHILALTKCQIFGIRNNHNPPSCTNLSSPETKYLLDSNSQLCFPLGLRGPCEELMIFYQNPSQQLSNYGFCDCDQGYKSEMPCKDSPIRKRIYIPRHRRCYTVFSQGPCDDGRWLIYDDEAQSPRCVPNPCLHHKTTSPTSNQFWFYDPKRMQCFQTVTQAYCQNSFKLELVHDSQYPKCKRKLCFPNLSNGIRSLLTCQSGSRFSYLTRSCKRSPTNFIGIG